MTQKNKADTANIRVSDISILSAHDIDVNLLLEFYNTQYPKGANSRIWKWLNRSPFYEKRTPLVVSYHGRVIGHAGMIPFDVILDGKYYTASWFIDFTVLPEFQGSGIGTLLAKKWMEFSDISVTFCNKKALNIFKQAGWVEYPDSYLHRFFLKPFSRPRIVKSFPNFAVDILNAAVQPYAKMVYQRYASSNQELCFNRINPDVFEECVDPLPEPNKDVLIPLRDSEYISWRLLNSPHRDKYRIFWLKDIKDVRMIIKLGDGHDSPHIDLLRISSYPTYEIIRRMIASLAMWGIAEGYSYIRYYTSDRPLSNHLNRYLKSDVSYPHFAYHAKENILMGKLKNCSWRWELIDSDFERFSPCTR